MGRSSLWVCVVVTGWVLVHTLGRWLVSSSVELDQAEQLILAQEFRWSYGAQPPLYSWLQAAAFDLCGTNLLALTLVKAACLVATFQFLYLAARVLGDVRSGWLTLFGALLIPQVVWELQRDLTHSALVAAASAFTLYVVAKVLRSPSVIWYGALGCAAGLGVLSKYNYGLLFASLLLAWSTIPDLRARLIDRRIFWSLAGFALVLGPWMSWSFNSASSRNNPSGFLGAFAADQRGMGESLMTLFAAVCIGAVPCLVGFRLLGFRTGLPIAASLPAASYRKLMARTLVTGLLLCLVLALVIQGRFKDRLLLPLLLVVPVAGALWVAPRLSHRRWVWVVRGGIAAGIAASLALPVVTIIGATTGRPNRMTAPFDHFARELKSRAPTAGVILAGNRWVGGNLKLHFPRSQVYVYGDAVPAMLPGQECLVTWDATERATPSPRFWDYVSKICGESAVADARSQLQAPFRFSKKPMKLGYQIFHVGAP